MKRSTLELALGELNRSILELVGGFVLNRSMLELEDFCGLSVDGAAVDGISLFEKKSTLDEAGADGLDGIIRCATKSEKSSSLSRPKRSG